MQIQVHIKQILLRIVSTNSSTLYYLYGLPTVDHDWDGATLIVVYKDCGSPPDALNGTFFIYDGLEVRRDDPSTSSVGSEYSQVFLSSTLPVPSNFSNSKSFVAVGDVEIPLETWFNFVLGQNPSTLGISICSK